MHACMHAQKFPCCLQSSVHGSTRNYQTPSVHGLHNRSTDPDSAPGLFTAAGALIWYTGALTGSLPVAQVYDAGLDRARARVQCVFPGSTGGQSSSWQRWWLQGVEGAGRSSARA